ncbi:uncharacterized protein PGTG_04064 [Puccinia graminis f. sp. tritici CRL 75-36-700-3]|uniref:Uncharacterized protein n=1 Tax=Puccinia graminis f. sp. tritici (strain CRL 75-36-700-3 / race SCCL) TaxID=418459 RepID=E3K1D3_PUCGT|nr:uncharacterized protein PGTG_04064 [Puccinia graminis f. sp. tritici CRL 75-36-700-3]EFP78108.1 hypothetical protein PGTG_04064 [Puccinia graminis f. sp. tritici CRL 75-36-700-3]
MGRKEACKILNLKRNFHPRGPASEAEPSGGLRQLYNSTSSTNLTCSRVPGSSPSDPKSRPIHRFVFTTYKCLFWSRPKNLVLELEYQLRTKVQGKDPNKIQTQYKL